MTDRLLLERLAADGWPPLERADAGQWRLRAARGVTRRANSALPLGPPVHGDALDERLAAVTAFYTARGLPAAVQVSDPVLDAELDARGWTSEVPTAVLTGPVPPAGPGEVTSAPDDDWLSCWDAVDGRGGPEALQVVATCLARVSAAAGYAAAREDGRTVAVARGVVADGWLGVFSVAVLPSARRRGHAGRVLGALGAWAGRSGASGAYLQVRDDNDAAHALWARLGFVRAYPYCYRYGPST